MSDEQEKQDEERWGLISQALGLGATVDEELADDMLAIIRVLVNAPSGYLHIMRVVPKIHGECVVEHSDLKERYVLALYCLLHREGLIEYGTTIRGSWLTPRGKDLWETLFRGET